jgi:hypothetical protein
MKLIVHAMYWLEVVGGARRLPPRLRNTRMVGLLMPLWWVLLLLLTVAFVGRSTKFIYVDF